ncbi:MAG: MamI family restriction endonuclease [bacterium]|nr:MamI family restriction endonuclease [bacterium]
MQPNNKFITISDNRNKIQQLLRELVLQPRLNAIKWSTITKQTPNIKIGYPGQHLASLITGMEGERTGARGNDLIDGSEVKSCSRIDQLDSCKECGAPVARLEEECSNCESKNIARKNDSKWLFGVRNEDDLSFLIHGVKRIFLIIGDYSNFDERDFNTLRFQAFEIWPESERNSRFAEIMTNYYRKIYLAHKKKSPTKNPAPKNFWPYQYQFYVCNPIQTFSCIVENANLDPQIKIIHYVDPAEDRSKLPSVVMPPSVLSDQEIKLIFRKAKDEEIAKMIKPELSPQLGKIKNLSVPDKRALLIGVDETLRSYLPLRDTDRIATSTRKYARRSN